MSEQWPRINMDRRRFLKSSGGVAAGAAAMGCTIGARDSAEAEAPSVTHSATLPYPRTVIARAGELEVDQPVAFHYPDDQAQCAVLKTGRETSGGVGPDSDIVAFSTLCPHMGMPLQYDSDAQTYKCFEHFSIFDPDRLGQQVCGHATQDLPQVELEYDPETDELLAVGVQGLIYGRASNLL